MTRRRLLAGAGASIALAACGSAPRRARRGAAQRIVVIGAGLAGLVAAWELDRAGHDVTIVEARDRPGGRIETLREPFADGLYAEAGATFISDAHALVRRYCTQFGLPLRRVMARGAGEVYHVGGQRVWPGDPQAVWPLPLTPEERGLGLRGMWTKYVESALDRLRDDYDTMTGAQFLKARGASAGAVTLLGLGYLELAGDGVGSYSALAMLRDLAHRRQEKESFAIADGNDRLPAALAARLGERVRYRMPVVRIESGDRMATVIVRGATAGRIEADRVVCAVPGSVLKTIEVVPAWSTAKRRALEALSYTSVSRVFVQTTRRPGESAPLSLTTDRPIQWVWESSAGQPGRRGILESYTAGAAARRVALMSADERFEFVRDELTRVLPSQRGALEPGVSKAWDDDPFARGAYVWFKPGEATTLPRELARPEGRVHFAGEHVSSKPGWMEGAIESALRAVEEITAL